MGSTSPGTPPDVVRAAHAVLDVTDLSRARWFWVDLLGMVVTAEDPDALYLRGYEETTHHSLVLRRAGTPAARLLGYRVRTPADLDHAERYFTELNCPVRRVPAGTTRGIGEAVRVVDPLGFPVEFFYDIDRVERLTQRYDLRAGAEPARIDHFNIMVPDVPTGFRFYTRLGFGCSETIEDEQNLYAAWMFRKPTVHDIALTGGAGPRLHHVAFFTPEAANVLRLADIFGSLHEEHRLERGPGRHGVSNAFYLYLRDPDGHRVEMYTSDYYTGDPDHPTLRWDVRDPRRRDFWGHPVVASWYEEASPVLDLDGNPAPLTEPAQRESEVGADGLGVRGAARSAKRPGD